MTYTIGDWKVFAGGYEEFAPELEFDLESDRCALLVVDVQRKMCDPGVDRGIGATLRTRLPDLAGPYFDRLGDTVLPNISLLLTVFRNGGARVIFTTAGPMLASGDDLPFAFRQQYRSAHTIDDAGTIHAASPEFQIVESVRPQAGELVINKVSRSAFAATGLESILHNLGVDQLVLCGGATHACVESTGRSAADLGFKVAVVDDACISQFPLLHDAALINFHMSMGRVMTTQQVVDEIGAARG